MLKTRRIHRHRPPPYKDFGRYKYDIFYWVVPISNPKFFLFYIPVVVVGGFRLSVTTTWWSRFWGRGPLRSRLIMWIRRIRPPSSLSSKVSHFIILLHIHFKLPDCLSSINLLIQTSWAGVTCICVFYVRWDGLILVIVCDVTVNPLNVMIIHWLRIQIGIKGRDLHNKFKY